jgi:hypothetical protein
MGDLVGNGADETEGPGGHGEYPGGREKDMRTMAAGYQSYRLL